MVNCKYSYVIEFKNQGVLIPKSKICIDSIESSLGLELRLDCIQYKYKTNNKSEFDFELMNLSAIHKPYIIA